MKFPPRGSRLDGVEFPKSRRAPRQQSLGRATVLVLLLGLCEGCEASPETGEATDATRVEQATDTAPATAKPPATRASPPSEMPPATAKPPATRASPPSEMPPATGTSPASDTSPSDTSPSDTSPASDAAASVDSSSPANAGASKLPFEGTATAIEEKRAGPQRQLERVRVARHPGFDRAVFEFSGGVPGYRLEYIDEPVRSCGSGQVVPLAGDGWLQVQLSSARAHDESGRPTVEHGKQKPQLPIVRELQPTCDFEGVVTYVLGLAAPNRYRTLELTDPPRLVVDIRHD